MLVVEGAWGGGGWGQGGAGCARQRGQNVQGPGNGGDVVPCRNREWAGRPGMPGSRGPRNLYQDALSWT